jgi:hypothetical protein
MRCEFLENPMPRLPPQLCAASYPAKNATGENREGRRMVTTREPGDLPFHNHAFPGGVLRMKLFPRRMACLLLRTPTFLETGGRAA